MSRLQFTPLRIEKIQDQTHEAYTIYFHRPEETAFSYLPGQYLTLRLNMDGEELYRAYSISSAPGIDEQLAITIKRGPKGKASHYLHDHYQEGDTIDSLPPQGTFTVDLRPNRPRHYMLIGAGSGVVPLYSILRSVLAAEPGSEVSLWYGSRTRESIIFRKELSELGEQYGQRLHVLHSLSEPEADWKGFRGRLNQERIYDLVSEVFMQSELPKVYYICGPTEMMEAAEAALRKHSVNFNDVNRESFQAPIPQEKVSDTFIEPRPNGQAEVLLQTQEVRVFIDGDDAVIPVHPEETILQAAIEADLDPPFSCQAGICTACKARLVNGEVFMDRDDGLTEEELKDGYILTCQAHPLDDKVEVRYE